MQLLTTFLLVVLLSVVAVQDFRDRAISWYLIPLLFALFVYSSLQTAAAGEVIFSFMVNVAFTAAQLLILTLYFSIKQKKAVNIVNSLLGIGDILLLLVLCAAFSPVNYFIFYISSLIITIAGFIIYRFLINGKTATIPLAGAMSLVMIALICYRSLSASLNFTDDTLVLNILNIN